MDAPSTPALDAPTKIAVRELSMYYGDTQALTDVTLEIPDRRVTALIGPSGCGKSTFLRCLNRMNDHIRGTRIEGSITMDGEDLYGEDVDPVVLRRRVGMVFQKSNPFPKSIFENVAYRAAHPRAARRPGGEGDRASAASSRPPSGTRWPTASTAPRSSCRAASSSGSASRAPSRSSPRCC